ncbi:MAG TPA: hypothetical protein VHG08_19670, partial [Longimicrobium sp.]|nr:hypothetical protein [Longimicrobium sp.]
MRFIALFLTILATAAQACTPVSAASRQPVAARPESGAPEPPAREGLVRLAARMMRAGPAVDAVWPGFWGADQGFMLLHPRDTALLVLPGTPPAEYEPLTGPVVPPELRGRAYLRRAYPPELGPNAFSIAYAVGADTVPALEPKGRSSFSRLEFYYHESFHGYQHRRFAESRDGDRRVGMRERLVDSAVTASPEFAALAEVERRLLAQAVEAEREDHV